MSIETVVVELTIAEATALYTASNAVGSASLVWGRQSRLMAAIRSDLQAHGYSIVSEARRKAAAHG